MQYELLVLELSKAIFEWIAASVVSRKPYVKCDKSIQIGYGYLKV
jgi:hypothetical protein